MAITESRIRAIEQRLDELTQNFLQTQINQVPITAKVDETSNKVTDLTPYTASAEAFYGEKEKTFYNVPQGNLLVFFDAFAGSYSVERIEDRLTIKFPEALQKATKITISIQ